MKRASLFFFLFVFALSPYFGLPGWTPALAAVAGFLALGLIGLNLIFGVAGMLALGQSAFMALPAYVSGMMMRLLDAPMPLAFLCAIGVSILVALCIGLIFIRLPGIYFAIGTLGFAFVLEGLTRAFPSITGGASGLVLSGSTNLTSTEWHALSIVLLFVGMAAYGWLLRGAWMRALRLVRADELAAQALGIDVAHEKIKAFVVGSTFSAVAGLCLSYYVGVVVPESGGVNQSLELLAMIIIGGAGTLLGPLVGAALVQWLFAVSGAAGHYELLVYGLAFLGVILFAPRGVAGSVGALLLGGNARAGVLKKSAEAPLTPAPRTLGSACLKITPATKRYGGLTAVDNVGVTVAFGEIVALIGPNGAGKSTFFNIISGIEKPDSGAVYIGGGQPASALIHRRARMIGRSFQVPRLVEDMSVLDNVMLRVDQVEARASEAERRAVAMAQLGVFGLDDLAYRLVRELSLGYHKQIELARASVGNPPLLLMDEPAVGLTAVEVERLATMLRRLKVGGAAIFVVEHNIGFVASVADRIIVMDRGCIIAEGGPQRVMNDEAVKRAYFGALS
jgi:ABC-type branched-subunit amino acid transport system ATPase component/ABC-type branched-subunit amino acid transport system permease subunit